MEISLLFVSFFVLLFAGVGVGVAMLAASIVNVVIFGIPETIIPERMINSLNSSTSANSPGVKNAGAAAGAVAANGSAAADVSRPSDAATVAAAPSLIRSRRVIAGA